MAIKLAANERWVFIGDSITDVDWRKDPEAIGHGYVRMIRDYLRAMSPAEAPEVLNRGISGNKMPDLQKRWQRDVIDLRPNVLSIYIGINDVWHGLIEGRSGCSLEDFTAGYHDVLSRTRASVPDARIILCEPSALWLADPPGADERMEPYAQAVRQITHEFPVECVVPLRAAFAQARAARGDIAWTSDGVHPTSSGHTLIAHAWLNACGLL